MVRVRREYRTAGSGQTVHEIMANACHSENLVHIPDMKMRPYGRFPK